MVKEKFLMVSLEETQAKQLAEVLSNDTSRKIINYLSEHEDATETQIAQELGIPLPTVHYNMQKLKEAQLVAVEEFHYSKKGREVDHYKLANKYVIITPKPVKGIKTLLRNILPVTFGVAGISAIIYLFKRYFTDYAPSAMQFVQEAAPAIAEKTVAAGAADMAALEIASEAPTFSANAAAQAVYEPNIALWFLIGGISAILIYLVMNFIRREK